MKKSVVVEARFVIEATDQKGRSIFYDGQGWTHELPKAWQISSQVAAKNALASRNLYGEFGSTIRDLRITEVHVRRPKKNPRRKPYDPGRSRIAASEEAVRELTLFAKNESALFPQRVSIHKNLLKRIRKGTYDRSLAWKLWKYWFDAAAKAYAKQFSIGTDWAQIFSPGDREQAAKEFAIQEENAMRRGEYDDVQSNPRQRRPPLGTKEYVNRKSEATKRKPTKRLRKRRAKNRGGRRFPNPLGFGIFVRKGSGPRMHFDGQKFSSNGPAKVFPSKNLALHQGEHLLMKYPILRKYNMTVEGSPGKA